MSHRQAVLGRTGMNGGMHGELRNVQKERSSPGHVIVIRARDRSLWGISEGLRGDTSQKERARWNLEAHVCGFRFPGLWGALGAQVAWCFSAPGDTMHNFKGTTKRSLTVDTWRASLAYTQPPRTSLLPTPSKIKLLHGQREQNTQTNIINKLKWQVEKRVFKFLSETRVNISCTQKALGIRKEQIEHLIAK